MTARNVENMNPEEARAAYDSLDLSEDERRQISEYPYDFEGNQRIINAKALYRRSRGIQDEAPEREALAMGG